MAARKKTAGRKAAVRGSAVQRGSREGSRGDARAIEQYEHKGKQRANNPPVGLVKPENDPDSGKRTWAFDPHLDPQLVWAGKAEHTSFEVPTVSLHVHERIDPKTILAAVRKRAAAPKPAASEQFSLFARPEENPPLREALDFYRHAHGWSNRLVAGDSLLVMNSLLEKEGMAGKVQMVYLDPPYGIRYGSNFQPFVNKRDVKDGKDEDLTQEPEMIRAFRDTWELGIHSYLTYLRNRLLLARELLHESGSIFVQIGTENVHHVRETLDDVFGSLNYCGQIVFRKTTGKASQTLDNTYDFLLWYSRQQSKLKVRRLFAPRLVQDDMNLRFVELGDGTRRSMSDEELSGAIVLPDGGRVFRPNPVTSARSPQDGDLREFNFAGKHYYELAHPEEGVGSGFVYKTVPHVTLKSIANNPEIREGMAREQIDRAIAKYADQETLYDQPRVDRSRARVTGPFTVEAVPAPVVKPLDAGDAATTPPHEADASAARSGETLRHAEWREELLKTGIRGKSGQRILFSRVEPLAGTRWLHAEAETRPNQAGADRVAEPGAARVAHRVVLSFGPEHAPLEQKQVERAWQEAGSLQPKPALLVFAAFQFDPEAAKDIDELTPAKAGMTLLKVQMNPDLLTADLKKKRASNESFWLVGQPDVELVRLEKGAHAGLWQALVRGFDYYNTKSGEIDSGSAERIALWMLDPDYDERSLLPRQVFFPMAGEGEGWARLARSLRAEIDEERIESYRGTISLPFEASLGQKVAVKLVDDRGIESLRILEIE